MESYTIYYLIMSFELKYKISPETIESITWNVLHVKKRVEYNLGEIPKLEVPRFY